MELCKSNCIYNSKSTSTGSGVAGSGFGVALVVAAWGSGFGVVMVIARVCGSRQRDRPCGGGGWYGGCAALG